MRGRVGDEYDERQVVVTIDIAASRLDMKFIEPRDPHPHGWGCNDVAASRLESSRHRQGRRPGNVVAPAVRLGKAPSRNPFLSPVRVDIAKANPGPPAADH